MPTRTRQNDSPVRYAVVGLGWFAQAAVLPAFQNATENSRLAALVTDDIEKSRQLGEDYKVPVVSYDDYDSLLASGDIDAVYIVLPNSLHCEYTVRAAEQGVHVLCEKPMAPSLPECEKMIAACGDSDVRLMIAYRLHFEQANLDTIHLVQSGRIGEPRAFDSLFTQQIEEGNSRLQSDLGGGPLEDIGIYCLNAARYLFRDEPIEVFAFEANNGERRFAEVPEMVSVTMRFPGERMAQFTCGFGAEDVSYYRVACTKGSVRLEPAYSFHFGLNQYVTDKDGQVQETKFPHTDHVGPELVHFSHCIREGIEPGPSGLEGLLDIRVIEAIRESARSGRVVKLEPFGQKRRPSIGQRIVKPPIKEPELVHADDPKQSD